MVSSKKPKRSRPSRKLTKAEKKAKRIARFLLRVDPDIIPQIQNDLSNEALISVLEPLFDEGYLLVVHEDYKQFCKEVISTKEPYFRYIRAFQDNFAPLLLEWIKQQEGPERARARKKKRQQRKRKYSHLISWTIHLTADLQGLFKDLQEVDSAPEMARRIDTHSFKEDIIFAGGTKERRPGDLLYAVASLPAEELQAFRKTLLKELEKEIRTAEKEEEVLRELEPHLKILEAKNAVAIDIAELVSFDYDTWGMKIFVGTHPQKMRAYLFDFEARNINDILDVIQLVINDYRTKRAATPEQDEDWDIDEEEEWDSDWDNDY
ncbi:MAG: hypothetical protein ACFFB3_06545 [Candidatus Hodarchaeota archaeon]